MGSAFAYSFSGATSKYLNSAGHNQPSMGGSLSRYHVPPYSVRSRVNSAWKPGNFSCENSSRNPRSASGTPATSASIISGTPDTNGSRVSPRPGSSKTHVPPEWYGSMMRIAFATSASSANVVPRTVSLRSVYESPMSRKPGETKLRPEDGPAHRGN